MLGNDDEMFGWDDTPKAKAPVKATAKAQAAAPKSPSGIGANINTKGKTNAGAAKVQSVQGSVTATLASVTKAAGGSTKPFDFSSPSPDDVVLQTQNQAFSKKKGLYFFVLCIFCNFLLLCLSNEQ